MWVIQFLAILGFIASIYFAYVKRNTKKNKNYKALCDITDIVSCTKAARSHSSDLLGFPNAWLGLVFYPFVFLLTFFEGIILIFGLSMIANALTLYLIYVSIKEKFICPVCVGIYIINFLLLIFSYPHI